MKPETFPTTASMRVQDFEDGKKLAKVGADQEAFANALMDKAARLPAGEDRSKAVAEEAKRSWRR